MENKREEFDDVKVNLFADVPSVEPAVKNPDVEFKPEDFDYVPVEGEVIDFSAPVVDPFDVDMPDVDPDDGQRAKIEFDDFKPVDFLQSLARQLGLEDELQVVPKKEDKEEPAEEPKTELVIKVEAPEEVIDNLAKDDVQVELPVKTDSPVSDELEIEAEEVKEVPAEEEKPEEKVEDSESINKFIAWHDSVEETKNEVADKLSRIYDIFDKYNADEDMDVEEAFKLCSPEDQKVILAIIDEEEAKAEEAEEDLAEDYAIMNLRDNRWLDTKLGMMLKSFAKATRFKSEEEAAEQLKDIPNWQDNFKIVKLDESTCRQAALMEAALDAMNNNDDEIECVKCGEICSKENCHQDDDGKWICEKCDMQEDVEEVEEEPEDSKEDEIDNTKIQDICNILDQFDFSQEGQSLKCAEAIKALADSWTDSDESEDENLEDDAAEEKVEEEDFVEEEPVVESKESDLVVPGIKCEQELKGADCAVKSCEGPDKVITHSEDEEPLDCNMKKPPLPELLIDDNAVWNQEF